MVEIKQIEGLLKEFDIELISFEMGIPLEKLKAVQAQIQIENQKAVKEETIKMESTDKIKETLSDENKKSRVAHARMKKMRRKYHELYTKGSGDTNKAMQVPSDEDINFVNLKLAVLKEILEKLDYNSQENQSSIMKSDREKKTNEFLSIIKSLRACRFTIQQAETLLILLEPKNIEKLTFGTLYKKDKGKDMLEKNRAEICRSLYANIDAKQSNTEDIEELKSLARVIARVKKGKDEIFLGALEGKLHNKINRLINEKAKEQRKCAISNEMESIIQSVISGTLNSDLANEVISLEAKKRVTSKPITKFSLTEDEEKKRILSQINFILQEMPEKYSLEDPMLAVKQLQKLHGITQAQAVWTVVTNLINADNLKGARELYNAYASANETMLKLEKKIACHEIGKIVVQILNEEQDWQKDEQYITTIEENIRRRKIPLSAIPLGKSKDGTVSIRLADIWVEDKNKEI